jgi:hypothetical protein
LHLFLWGEAYFIGAKPISSGFNIVRSAMRLVRLWSIYPGSTIQLKYQINFFPVYHFYLINQLFIKSIC